MDMFLFLNRRRLLTNTNAIIEFKEMQPFRNVINTCEEVDTITLEQHFFFPKTDFRQIPKKMCPPNSFVDSQPKINRWTIMHDTLNIPTYTSKNKQNIHVHKTINKVIKNLDSIHLK